MALRTVNGDVAFPSAARAAGTFTSGQVGTPSASIHVVLAVHCTAATGTGPTLNCSLEQSGDGTTWTAIAGSGITALTAAGNAMSNALVSDDYVRVTATVAGTTPSITFTATVLVFSD